MDLETALVASAEGLHEKMEATQLATQVSGAAPVESVRSLVLDKMLDWLCQNWYMKPGPVPRQERRLWQTEDLPDRTFVELPPYRLPTSRKGYILGFLESKPARMGERLFTGWDGYRQGVEEFVEKAGGSTGVGASDRNVSVVLSPAHGDLNGNNILLWLDYPDQPFLIDLPFYQERGHALQDLARLEVEIKFAIMDRQEDTPREELPDLDLTPSQVPLSQEMEEYLLSGDWPKLKPSWSNKG